MADDRRQQLADEVAVVIDLHRPTYGGPDSIACTAGCVAEWEPAHVAAALLSLFDPVAADAAAEALEAWAAKHHCSEIDDGFGGFECGWCKDSWAHTLPGGPGCSDARALRARAAAHRTPAPSSEEN